MIVRNREILVLALGSSLQDQNHKRGALFEQFAARLLSSFDMDNPKPGNFRVIEDGLELDIAGRHRILQRSLIAECKAYSRAVPGGELAKFLGKLSLARYDERETEGYFIAIPTLSSEGLAAARKAEENDKLFRLLTAETIFDLLENRGLIQPLANVLERHQRLSGAGSDQALLITEHGHYMALKEANLTTRLTERILVYSFGEDPVPQPAMDALKETSFAAGVPCERALRKSDHQDTTRIMALSTSSSATPPTIVEVAASSDEFEYHYPASPRYFVGRGRHLNDVLHELEMLSRTSARGRVFVVNAQSGWGKSSFALKIVDTIRKRGGFGVCIDSRTADGPAFVSAALRYALLEAEKSHAITLPPDATFASLQSSLDTLRQTVFRAPPLCLIFDQFENIFRNYALTQEFRNLAVAVSDLDVPVLLGFAWKTDLIAFTEGHPYQLRDHIRDRAKLILLEPFDAAEVGEILTRAQKASKERLHRDLRQKLREYSQGLPWLLKKLVSHMLRELRGGKGQEDLIAESLNIRSLFESDLRPLPPQEQAALRAIARSAPMPAADAVDVAGSARVVQSLVDQRLLVQIGERFDVYWDIFRDYLNTGDVPLEEAYILRLTPTSSGKLIQLLHAAGTPLTPNEAAKKLGTSQIAVFNLARDLRQLGVLAAVEGVLRFSAEVDSAQHLEDAIRSRVASSLRRHRAFSLFLRLARTSGRVRISDYARELPSVYPAVVAKTKTWGDYARAFAHWFEYAGLASIADEELALTSDHVSKFSLLVARTQRPRGVVVFPRSPPRPVLQLLISLARNADPSTQLKASTLRRAMGDAELLGLIKRVSGDRLMLTPAGKALASASKAARPGCVASVIASQPSVGVARDRLQTNPKTSSLEIGRAVAAHHGLVWADETATTCGKWLRAWMREAGAIIHVPGNLAQPSLRWTVPT